MAARRVIRYLFIPLVTAMLLAGCWLIDRYADFPDVIAVSPGQQVVSFIEAVYTGQLTAAAAALSPKARPLDLELLRAELQARFGEPIATTTQVRARDATRALVWSTTTTSDGDTLFLTWLLVRDGDRWVIRDIINMRQVFPDV